MASLKKKKSGGEGGANWMDTYGDMVTLLLCFFVLLYSMSTIDQEKWMMIVQSFNKDAEVSTDESPRGPDGDNDADLGNDLPMSQDEVNEDVEMILEYLAEYAASQKAADSDSDSESDSSSEAVSYSVGDGYVFISFNASTFFGGNSYELTASAREVLSGLCPLLEDIKPYIDEIKVSGHTATAQGTYDPYFDWRLSADRAAMVTAFIWQNTTIQAARLTPEGNGQWLPIADNTEESERAKNRRVELMISLAEEPLDNPFAGTIEEYYTMAEQEVPVQLPYDPTAAE